MSCPGVLSYVNSLYVFNEVNHIHIPVKHGMSKPCCIVNNTVCVHWTGRDPLWSSHIYDVATPPIHLFQEIAIFRLFPERGDMRSQTVRWSRWKYTVTSSMTQQVAGPRDGPMLT